MLKGHNPLQCIIPDYMMEQLITKAPQHVRDWALHSLAFSERLRGQRDILSMMSAPLPTGRKDRCIYDARQEFLLPGTKVRCEGDPPSHDPAVNEMYDTLGSLYDFYLDNFNRNSIDDEGHQLNATVHYGDRFNNAFWNGRQMVFGDGDGEIFNSFTAAKDVIAHELTHGVVEFTSNLIYSHQSGALNESFADAFASMYK